MKPAHEEIVDFLTSAPSPEHILKHRPTVRVQKRVAELILRSKHGTLSSDERDELGNFLHLEHIMRIAKAKSAIRLRKE